MAKAKIATAPEIKRIDLRKYDPAPYNPRRISDEAKAGLRASLEQHGYVDLIVVNRRTGHVIGGHQRREVLLEAGRVRVPAVIVDVSEIDEKKMNVSLNNPHIAGVFTMDLKPLLAELRASMPEEDVVSLRIDELRREIAAIKVEPVEGLTDPDDIPAPPKKARTKPGDLWELGVHRVLCGDAKNNDDIDRLLDGQAIRYGMHDPPYGISCMKGDEVGVSTGYAPARKYIPLQGDDVPFDPAIVLQRSRDSILWGANYYADKLPPLTAWIVWDKKAGKEWRNMFSDCELAWTSFNHKRVRMYRHMWVGFFREGPREERCHPTQKPVPLIVQIMEDLFVDDGMIADFYLGSGTTLIAAEQLGRRCFGLEIEPRYVDVIVKRWEDFTGRKAKRIRAKK